MEIFQLFQQSMTEIFQQCLDWFWEWQKSVKSSHSFRMFDWITSLTKTTNHNVWKASWQFCQVSKNDHVLQIASCEVDGVESDRVSDHTDRSKASLKVSEGCKGMEICSWFEISRERGERQRKISLECRESWVVKVHQAWIQQCCRAWIILVWATLGMSMNLLKIPFWCATLCNVTWTLCGELVQECVWK